MIKTFPKSRICVIDAYPSFETGLRNAVNFSKQHQISLNSSDGKKLLLSFCLKTIQETYNNTKSEFPKVFCISKKRITKKIEKFVSQYFDKMMESLTTPYCGKYDLNSPDLEYAAEASLQKYKSQKNFNKFIKKIKLHS